MSIIRHEIRQVSDENRGQPIISQAVVHDNVAYFAGITPNPIVGDIKTQTAQVLRRVRQRSWWGRTPKECGVAERHQPFATSIRTPA